MQSAGEHGVVVFSLGITGYEALSVPDDYIEAFINVFGRLKQKVTSFGPGPLGDISPPDVYGRYPDRKILFQTYGLVFLFGFCNTLEVMY